MRRHGHERLSAKQKAGMDSVSILKEETCYKLGEIQTYLTDFRDIIQSIEHDNAATAGFLKQPTKGRWEGGTQIRAAATRTDCALGGELARAHCAHSLSLALDVLAVSHCVAFQANPMRATHTIAVIAPMAVAAAVAVVLLRPARARTTRTRRPRSSTTDTATRPAPIDHPREAFALR